VPDSEWESVNTDPAHPVKVVLFEGWCVGYRPLSAFSLRRKWEAAYTAANTPHSDYPGRLGHNTLQSVTTINEALQQYHAITDQLDAFIHIDAFDPLYVYQWRLEQEHALWEKKGSGMSDDEVTRFVDGYYPAYELYTESLRGGVFAGQAEEAARGRQMRLVVGEDRRVREVVRI
jgi:D-glycerate 3-kinase